MDPAYWHILINPLPLYGLALGVVALTLAIFLKSPQAKVLGLILILIAGTSAIPVHILGERAYSSIKTKSDKEGQLWLDEHMDRAEKANLAYYGLIAVTGAALLLPRRYPKTAFPLVITVLLASSVVVGIGGWISQAGGRIRHSEFRTGEPPTPSGHHDHQH